MKSYGVGRDFRDITNVHLLVRLLEAVSMFGSTDYPPEATVCIKFCPANQMPSRIFGTMYIHKITVLWIQGTSRILQLRPGIEPTHFDKRSELINYIGFGDYFRSCEDLFNHVKSTFESP
ncbi:hypothetical protein AVEN_165136-1 [Araneus ventricosus]|uniref:Uncharacterized protein n=1 Tax=Araneus ventricosus TaxID=182803 RepID=A0A4Y2B6W2_ARAVE|nr:hypothetical protein AVEN_165136-1 [Araneus ventricosus]